MKPQSLSVLLMLPVWLYGSEQPVSVEKVKEMRTFEDQTIAAGHHFKAMSRKSLLVFNGKSTFNGSWKGGSFGAQVGVKVETGELLYNGIMDTAVSGGDKGRFFLEENTRLIIGPDAELNQQMPSMIQARPSYVHGKGSRSIFELHPDFQADHMGWPDLDTMKNNGFSVLFVEDATIISHATQSLPSVHKFAGNGNHTHHGVLVFQGAQSEWHIKSEAQVFDGVLDIRGTTRLHTEEDLLFTGHFFEDSHCYVGSWGEKDSQPEMIKSGTGKLIIMGTQLYGVPFTTRVTEGEIIYRTKAHDPGHYVRTEHPGRKWDNLELVVEKAGAVRLNPTLNFFETRIRSLKNAGSIHLGNAHLFVAQDMTLDTSSLMHIALDSLVRGPSKRRTFHPITIGGALELAGTITITGTPQMGRILIVKAERITGEASWNLPEGMKLEQDDTQIFLSSETP